MYPDFPPRFDQIFSVEALNPTFVDQDAGFSGFPAHIVIAILILNRFTEATRHQFQNQGFITNPKSITPSRPRHGRFLWPLTELSPATGHDQTGPVRLLRPPRHPPATAAEAPLPAAPSVRGAA